MQRKNFQLWFSSLLSIYFLISFHQPILCLGVSDTAMTSLDKGMDKHQEKTDEKKEDSEKATPAEKAQKLKEALDHQKNQKALQDGQKSVEARKNAENGNTSPLEKKPSEFKPQPDTKAEIPEGSQAGQSQSPPELKPQDTSVSKQNTELSQAPGDPKPNVSPEQLADLKSTPDANAMPKETQSQAKGIEAPPASSSDSASTKNEPSFFDRLKQGAESAYDGAKKVGESTLDLAKGTAQEVQKSVSSPEFRQNAAREIASQKWNDPANPQFKQDILNKAWGETHQEVVGKAVATANDAYPGLLNRRATSQASQTASSQIAPEVFSSVKSGISDAMNNKPPSPPSGSITTPGSRRIPSQSIPRSEPYMQAYNRTVSEISAAANPTASTPSVASAPKVSAPVSSPTMAYNPPATYYQSQSRVRIFGRRR